MELEGYSVLGGGGQVIMGWGLVVVWLYCGGGGTKLPQLPHPTPEQVQHPREI